MDIRHIPARIAELLAPFLADQGLVLWGVETAASGHRALLRVYLDRPRPAPATEPDGPDAEAGGVTIDDCARVSRHLDLLLDMDDIMSGAYVLEVSSPGLERRFFSPEQLDAYLGRDIDLRLHELRDGRKHFRGRLEARRDRTLTLTVDPRTQPFSLSLDWDDLKSVRLIHSFPETKDAETAPPRPTGPRRQAQ